MSPLRAAEIIDLDGEPSLNGDRSSGIRLKSAPEWEAAERPTLIPQARGRKPKPNPSELLDEVLFRIDCGDFDGALTAVDPFLGRVPVLRMTREQLGTEPLDYWELHMVSHIDGRATFLDLIDQADLPLSEATRVFCRLAERGITALR
jgi:hypothetical protein